MKWIQINIDKLTSNILPILIAEYVCDEII